jgi:hypothetical protein
MVYRLIASIFFFSLLTVVICESNLQAKMFERKIHTIESRPVYRYDQNWTEIDSSEEAALAELLSILSRSKTGRKLLTLARRKAAKSKRTLEELILAGEGSLTDTTLVRKFSPSHPDEVIYESRSKVYINRNLSVKNAVLDMAHELTHFSLREAFNPYKHAFGLKDFITSTVEGTGGEVEAYLVECRVLLELFKDRRGDSNCDQVINEKTGKVDKSLGIERFYQLGRYHSAFHNSLRKHDLQLKDFNSAGTDKANFISSAYGLPYPLAAVHEYESIMQRVCANDERRLAIMRQNQARAPASSPSSSFRYLASSHKERCSSFNHL